VEIYNNSDSDISLAGWYLQDSNDDNLFEFSQSAVLKQNEYLVACFDTSAFKTIFTDVENYIGDLDFKFGNDGDAIRLFDVNNELIDIVLYRNETPWPIEAAGNGSSLELKNPDFDNTQAENWQASKGHGTPGRKNSTFVITAIDQEAVSEKIPGKFNLFQNYPNPFNPTTRINYELQITNFVELSVYNTIGQKVAILVKEHQQAGYHQVEWDATGFSSGVYFYHLRAGEVHEVRKMLLLK
jgi:hypothetical protein